MLIRSIALVMEPQPLEQVWAILVAHGVGEMRGDKGHRLYFKIEGRRISKVTRALFALWVKEGHNGGHFLIEIE